ncbi:D-alanyl-D-alanine carboxypeptidase family protein [Paeniglutamicibacter sp. NPDC012692]|uniref:D-alanyl-D-alanine carboxypeptidase family protein n=1 Tax=Paeniglutamicibacter sp. NPDC012692 TaxID=3364388 RepID=UPI00369B0B06
MSKISFFSDSPKKPVSHRFWKQGLLLGLGASLALGSIAASPANGAPLATHATTPAAQGTSKACAKRINISVKTTANVHLRQGASVKKKSLKIIPANTTLRATAQASNGWYKVSHRGTIGHISNAHAKRVAAQKPSATKPSGGRKVVTGKYSTNRAGLTDRYWTKDKITSLYQSVGGAVRIKDIPRNSVAYRDLKLEKKGGQRSGWYFVRTQGTSGWVKSSALKRSSSAPTGNPKKYSYAAIKRMTNGKIDQGALATVSWDTEKTLIAAPAGASLTRMNTAFKKKFGKDLTIDLSYRTRATQDFYWKDLGPYIAARPGTSNHGWGTAIDFPETYDYSFRGKYYKWLKQNSSKYGWIHRKILEEGSPYAEAWHFEYYG